MLAGTSVTTGLTIAEAADVQGHLAFIDRKITTYEDRING
jgi:hypothetical protein